MRGFIASLAIAVGSSATAQADAVERGGWTAEKQATRLVRLLELPSRRLAAASELMLLGAAAVPALSRTMGDPRIEVVSRAAICLRMLGEDARSAIPHLKTLAKGKDPKLAYAAQWALAPFEPTGITLVADYDGKRLVEFDEAGKVVLEILNLEGVFQAERLPNGNYLVALAGKERVREIDRLGKVAWEYHEKGINPLGAIRLPNDNTLIANTNDGLLEVSPAGEVVWRGLKCTPWKVQALRNGNALIASGGDASEFDRMGKPVHRYAVAQVHEARRLANGHTLLAAYGNKSVVEVDVAGKIVRTIDVGVPVDSAIRTPDGGTIVGGAGTVVRYDAKGRLLWKRAVGRAGSVRYY